MSARKGRRPKITPEVVIAIMRMRLNEGLSVKEACEKHKPAISVSGYYASLGADRNKGSELVAHHQIVRHAVAEEAVENALKVLGSDTEMKGKDRVGGFLGVARTLLNAPTMGSGGNDMNMNHSVNDEIAERFKQAKEEME